MAQNGPRFITRVLKVSNEGLGGFVQDGRAGRLDTWQLATSPSPNETLKEAASYLRTKDIPVGFPTETVYGLGADATRSSSVQGIYLAKNRPQDNPLIVHISDLGMLRDLLSPAAQTNGYANDHADPIPDIYKPLIDQFWPGPLTILLPNPEASKLAPEVTAGLKTFGARMPSSPLALALIHLTGRPLAAPSANASTRPSATTASDVLEDMDGRIELILDGGLCDVGVESTVVDGLCEPPVILRPGGVSLDEIRACPGWENVRKAYKDQSEIGKAAPRAPGMKYKHYSPTARVILYEAMCPEAKKGITTADFELLKSRQVSNTSDAGESLTIGIIRTKYWSPGAGLPHSTLSSRKTSLLEVDNEIQVELEVLEGPLAGSESVRLLDMGIGQDARSIAQGLFSALRELDRRKADLIFVEGIEDTNDIAAAVMNRLRKAASDIRS
jgi:L-threonylcarbamoyladenylate synthase